MDPAAPIADPRLDLSHVGDTRLQVLVTYANGRDDRLPRKAIEMFDCSRLTDGLTQARYPSRVTQVMTTCASSMA